MTSVIYDKITNERLEATKHTLTEVANLIRAEVKKYRRQDIILSERESAENEKIAKILEALIPRISDLYKGP